MVVTHADPPADLPYKERPLHIYFDINFIIIVYWYVFMPGETLYL